MSLLIVIDGDSHASQVVIKWFSRRLGPTRMDKIDNMNPIHACHTFNPFFQARSGALIPSSIEETEHLQLVDGGMSNNLPLSVFLHVS